MEFKMPISTGAAPVSQRPAESPVNRSFNRPPQPTTQSPENQKFFYKVFDSMITLSLVAIFFGIPLFFTGVTFQGLAFDKQVYFYMWAILALIGWAGKGVTSGELVIRRTPLDLPIVIFWGVYLVSTIFSVDRWHSFWGFFGDPSRGFLNVTALIVVYYLILSHLDRSRFDKIFGFINFSAILVVIWSFLRIMNFLPAKLAAASPISTLGSVSGLGIFLAMSLPLFMVAIFKASESQKSIFRMISLASLFLATILDVALLNLLFDYIPLFSLLFGLAFFLLFILALIVRPAVKLSWLPLAVAVLVLFIPLLTGNMLSKKGRINLPVEVNPSIPLSWEVAKSSVSSGVGQFLLGSGPATYGYDFSKFKPASYNLEYLYNLRFYQGSGAIFEMLPTIGVLGTVSLLAVVLSFVGFCLYLLMREKEKNKLMSLGLFSSILIVMISCVISMIDNGKIIASRLEGSLLMLTVLMVPLTLYILSYESQIEQRTLKVSLKASPKYALTFAFLNMVIIAGTVYMFAFLGQVLAADVYMGMAMREKTDLSKAMDRSTKAINRYGKEGRYYTQISQGYMLMANQEALKPKEQRDEDKIRMALTSSIAAAKEGVNRMPKDVMAVESLAFIYENTSLYVGNDSLKMAGDIYYNQALSLEPLNPNFKLKIGQIKINSANLSKLSEEERNKVLDEAKIDVQDALKLKDNLAPAYFNLALIQDAQGNKDESIKNFASAFQLDQNINYAFSLARALQNRGQESDLNDAEFLFNQILGAQPNEVNVLFYSGLLYEKMGQRDKAAERYEKILSQLPENDANKETRSQIQKMINTVKDGGRNIGNDGQVDIENSQTNQ